MLWFTKHTAVHFNTLVSGETIQEFLSKTRCFYKELNLKCEIESVNSRAKMQVCKSLKRARVTSKHNNTINISWIILA